MTAFLKGSPSCFGHTLTSSVVRTKLGAYIEVLWTPKSKASWTSPRDSGSTFSPCCVRYLIKSNSYHQLCISTDMWAFIPVNCHLDFQWEIEKVLCCREDCCHDRFVHAMVFD